MATGGHDVENRRLVIVIAITIVGVFFFFGDDIGLAFDELKLRNSSASCADFHEALADAQMSFLRDCDCLDENNTASEENEAALKASFSTIEACVRDAVAACSEDDNLHKIYRTCIASAAAPSGYSTQEPSKPASQRD